MLLDTQLVVAEHHTTRDRVRRIGFDRVSSLLTWRRPPLGSMGATTLVLGGIAMMFLFSGLEEFTVIAAVLFALAALILLVLAYRGKTHILITRAGQDVELVGIVPRRRLRAFLVDLQQNIERTQAEAEADALARQEENAAASSNRLEEILEDGGFDADAANEDA